MLVSFFSFVGFTSMSPGRALSPTIIPSYTGSPGATNSVPRSCRLNSAKPTTTPFSIETITPRARPVLEEAVVHDAGAARVGEELGAIAEETAGRDAIQDADQPLPRILHLD